MRSNFVFTFQSRVITYSPHYKYLGLLFNEHLDWDQAIEAILAKANQALTVVNHKARTCGGFHFKTYTMLFNQLVVPIITTNAFIWGHKDYKSIFRIQYNAMRFLLGVGKACTIVGPFGETGWVPLSLTIKFSILQYSNRLSRMGSNRIAFKMHTWSNSLADKGKQNWVFKTKLLHQSIGDPAAGLTLDETWAALAEITSQEWSKDVNSIPDNSESGGRLRLYRQIKTSPSVEQYILLGMSLNKRRVITQIRTGCLPLEIELGRYRSPKTPLANRIV